MAINSKNLYTSGGKYEVGVDKSVITIMYTNFASTESFTFEYGDLSYTNPTAEELSGFLDTRTTQTLYFASSMTLDNIVIPSHTIVSGYLHYDTANDDAYITFYFDGTGIPCLVTIVYQSSTGGYTFDITYLATTTQLGNKQDKLVSGTNIKTVNGNSLLGSGDVTIQADSKPLYITGSFMDDGAIVVFMYGNENVSLATFASKILSGSPLLGLGFSGTEAGIKTDLLNIDNAFLPATLAADLSTSLDFTIKAYATSKNGDGIVEFVVAGTGVSTSTPITATYSEKLIPYDTVIDSKIDTAIDSYEPTVDLSLSSWKADGDVIDGAFTFMSSIGILLVGYQKPHRIYLPEFTDATGRVPAQYVYCDFAVYDKFPMATLFTCVVHAQYVQDDEGTASGWHTLQISVTSEDAVSIKVI